MWALIVFSLHAVFLLGKSEDLPSKVPDKLLNKSLIDILNYNFNVNDVMGMFEKIFKNSVDDFKIEEENNEMKNLQFKKYNFDKQNYNFMYSSFKDYCLNEVANIENCQKYANKDYIENVFKDIDSKFYGRFHKEINQLKYYIFEIGKLLKRRDELNKEINGTFEGIKSTKEWVKKTMTTKAGTVLPLIRYFEDMSYNLKHTNKSLSYYDMMVQYGNELNVIIKNALVEYVYMYRQTKTYQKKIEKYMERNARILSKMHKKIILSIFYMISDMNRTNEKIDHLINKKVSEFNEWVNHENEEYVRKLKKRKSNIEFNLDDINEHMDLSKEELEKDKIAFINLSKYVTFQNPTKTIRSIMHLLNNKYSKDVNVIFLYNEEYIDFSIDKMIEVPEPCKINIDSNSTDNYNIVHLDFMETSKYEQMLNTTNFKPNDFNHIDKQKIDNIIDEIFLQDKKLDSEYWIKEKVYEDVKSKIPSTDPNNEIQVYTDEMEKSINTTEDYYVFKPTIKRYISSVRNLFKNPIFYFNKYIYSFEKNFDSAASGTMGPVVSIQIKGAEDEMKGEQPRTEQHQKGQSQSEQSQSEQSQSEQSQTEKQQTEEQQQQEQQKEKQEEECEGKPPSGEVTASEEPAENKEMEVTSSDEPKGEEKETVVGPSPVAETEGIAATPLGEKTEGVAAISPVDDIKITKHDVWNGDEEGTHTAVEDGPFSELEKELESDIDTELDAELETELANAELEVNVETEPESEIEPMFGSNVGTMPWGELGKEDDFTNEMEAMLVNKENDKGEVRDEKNVEEGSLEYAGGLKSEPHHTDEQGNEIEVQKENEGEREQKEGFYGMDDKFIQVEMERSGVVEGGNQKGEGEEVTEEVKGEDNNDDDDVGNDYDDNDYEYDDNEDKEKDEEEHKEDGEESPKEDDVMKHKKRRKAKRKKENKEESAGDDEEEEESEQEDEENDEGGEYEENYDDERDDTYGNKSSGKYDDLINEKNKHNLSIFRSASMKYLWRIPIINSLYNKCSECKKDFVGKEDVEVIDVYEIGEEELEEIYNDFQNLSYEDSLKRVKEKFFYAVPDMEYLSKALKIHNKNKEGNKERNFFYDAMYGNDYLIIKSKGVNVETFIYPYFETLNLQLSEIKTCTMEDYYGCMKEYIRSQLKKGTQEEHKAVDNADGKTGGKPSDMLSHKSNEKILFVYLGTFKDEVFKLPKSQIADDLKSAHLKQFLDNPKDYHFFNNFLIKKYEEEYYFFQKLKVYTVYHSKYKNSIMYGIDFNFYVSYFSKEEIQYLPLSYYHDSIIYFKVVLATSKYGYREIVPIDDEIIKFGLMLSLDNKNKNVHYLIQSEVTNDTNYDLLKKKTGVVKIYEVSYENLKMQLVNKNYKVQVTKTMKIILQKEVTFNNNKKRTHDYIDTFYDKMNKIMKNNMNLELFRKTFYVHLHKT
ncbi:conserved Plasmodium protein, unknown function [Plasmodium knowlesi strain H]|uniref:Uncharacterized protein n=3 Tax=Plasmodium knowlesi TaxID=5850 RepID=A0A5K1UC88_PLAKH|nr:conserved Plasmodium protein, unknown function [Plasmodium knowlesi strain H]OTN64889.1 Uncharacterized protein PKNOH_S120150800 [Plasmodium knowlesi]CAA9988365.1 conserved Plasmodium protein, unknown function [Plasmodium knowlesi strain H]SBO20032.1 conserved Plasmodium protein, unknown function [Plasmodium knowlesi strain H]SBO20326.1 conserved Plasmodium protein, unknown function [Plasmodium knowlesi strain H]VVS77839.1 conserved Plasmodium protein, unknown function [Plasmodium knowlesi |eukprot:XP_002259346.1 hypothetical protein, conserved in Plasmodium species [Plasmodium knowlesi strain H]